MVAPLASGVAVAARGTFKVREYQGRYAIDSHRIVTGFFAKPRMTTKADVILIVSASGTPDAASKARARNWAANGRIAIVPDLGKTYGAMARLSRASAMTALNGDLRRFGRMTLASGRVTVALA